jgi:hypothetical protein
MPVQRFDLNQEEQLDRKDQTSPWDSPDE